MADTLQVRVAAITRETPEISRIELVPTGGELPPFTAGAHVDLHLPNGQVRSYSLMNAQDDAGRYVLGIALDRASRGGSRYVHERLAEGDTLTVSAPRNHFPLNESASRTVLFGGGIGVTPMLSMAARLQQLGRPWQLHYCSRSRAGAAFLADLAPYGANAITRFDDEHAGFLDFEGLMIGNADADFYCCGPQPMMAAFLAAAQARGIAKDRVHIEYFQPPEELAPPAGGFEVVLARSGKRLAIPEGRSILEELQKLGIPAPSSCESGICGECQVTVLEGEPDHKDFVLSDAERASNKVMMICCSGSRTGRLVLDI